MVEINNNIASVIPTLDIGPAWRATQIFLRPPERNGMKRNVFIYCIEGGQIVRDGRLKIRWGWAGMLGSQAPEPKVCDKRPPDPYSTDIPIFDGAHIYFEVLDERGYPSDRILNLHANFEGPGPEVGADWGHHSWDVFVKLLAGVITVVPPPQPGPETPTTISGPTIPSGPGGPPVSLFGRLDDLERRVKALEAKG
jgi:hypothetical protein